MSTFSPNEKANLLCIARKALESYLNNGTIPRDELHDEFLTVKRGCFVSLKQNGALRGCIGNFMSNTSLYLLIREMAIAAASKDPRFYPLSTDELPGVKIEISVLSPLRKIDSIDEISIGEHGIYLEKNFCRGVLLPQVAVEYKWDRLTFLEQTCIKANLNRNDWKEDADIYIFSAEVFGE